MNIEDIKTELANNPGTYGALTDADVVPIIIIVTNVSTRQSISGSELFGYTDATEYDALTDTQKQQWLGLCGIDSVTKDAVPLIKNLFPSNSTTWTNIVKTETKYPFAGVNEGDIRKARNS